MLQHELAFRGLTFFRLCCKSRECIHVSAEREDSDASTYAKACLAEIVDRR